MDLETDLARLLHARDTVTPVGDPVPAVHTGMRRRRRQQRLQTAAAALSVTAVAIAGTVLVQDRRNGPAPQTPATSAPTEVPVSGPVAITDIALQGQQGFAVGSVPCGQGRCTVLLVSADGGATWAQRQARGLPATCSDTACASHVRFADTRVGYAFGLGLWVTTDAGRTWSTSPAVEVEALEISGDTAVRVVADQPGCQSGCAYRVQTAPVGSVVWRTTYGPADLSGNGVGLVRRGDRVVVTALARVGDEGTTVLRSTDGGESFTRDADPCSHRPDLAFHTVDLSLGADGVAVALCEPRGAVTGVGGRVSADGGRTFGGLLPLGPDATKAVAALSPEVFLAQVYRDTALVMRRTDDGGATWTDVAQQELGNSDLDADRAALQVSSSTEAIWLLLDGSGYQRTRDGGRAWETIGFTDS